MTADRSLPKVGDMLQVECDDTEGVRGWHSVCVERVVRLNCGCRRLEVTRPGPRAADSRRRDMHAYVSDKPSCHHELDQVSFEGAS
jgi:hypothetical protein